MDPIAIRPLSTGRVWIHDDMYRGRGPGLIRRARILRPGPMGEERPIHAWVIDHPDGTLLVDTGETRDAPDAPFARFDVDREDELDHRLGALGVAPRDVDRVVLTHVHGDHVDGLVHLPGARVIAHDEELASARSVMARAARRIAKQPLPPGFAPEPLTLDGPAVGTFDRSKALTDDGRVIAVPLPGHTPGHIGILVVQPNHHVLIGGDSAYDVAQLRDLAVDGVSPSRALAVATMRRILAHGQGHPTVYLPSHDPGSARRLAETVTL